MLDVELLYDVNLLSLAVESLLATWQITRLQTGPEPEPGWAEATHAELRVGALRLLGAAGPVEGTWSLQRTQPLKQPYLAFKLPQGEAHAQVTRLRHSPSGERKLLRLYFESGLELELVHP